MTTPFATIGVLGGGAWGTALAQVAAAGGAATPLWARDPATIAAVNVQRTNPRLPGIALSPAVCATADIATLADCDALLVVVPATATAAVLGQLAAWPPRPLVLCAKGLGPGGSALAEVAASTLPGWPVVLLSGPTFAHEVARGLPAAATLACRDERLAASLASRLARPAFRLYTSDDVVGVGLGGAIKNVLAVAAGVVVGRGLGDNARAAVVTRGFAEMRRYALACGAAEATLGGLSGLGDVVLTCASSASRNFAFGMMLGAGQGAATATAAARGVVEGAATAAIVLGAAAQRRIDLPIVTAVADLVAGTATVAAVVTRLLDRPLRREE